MGKKPNLKDWAQHAMAFYDERFKTDSSFCMVLANQILRHKAMNIGSVVAKDLPPEMTIADLQESVKNNDLTVLDQLRYIGGQIEGSGQYFYFERKKMKVLEYLILI